MHPSQKPLEVIEKCILDSTEPGDIVLDCFTGSGTTAVACIRRNRQFIGFEIDEKYYNLSLKRIEQEREGVEKK